MAGNEFQEDMKANRTRLSLYKSKRLKGQIKGYGKVLRGIANIPFKPTVKIRKF